MRHARHMTHTIKRFASWRPASYVTVASAQWAASGRTSAIRHIHPKQHMMRRRNALSDDSHFAYFGFGSASIINLGRQGIFRSTPETLFVQAWYSSAPHNGHTCSIALFTA